MAVPISYNLRNLIERKGTTLMTAVGIALTVAVLITSVAMTIGLNAVFSGSGDPRQLLVMRTGTDAELTSTVSNETYQIVRRLPGIATDKTGEPMVSPEAITVVNLPSVDSPEGMNVTVRGLLPVGIAMRPMEIVAGRALTPGLREVVVGESIARRYPAAQIGKDVRFGRGLWKVVGVFRVGETAANSEIWSDLDQLRGDFERAGGSSSLLVRLNVPVDKAEQDIAAVVAKPKPKTPDGATPAAKDKPQPDFARPFADAVTADQRLNAGVTTEKAYYSNLTSSGIPLLTLGYLVAVIMAVGSGFAATNTMYAAVARRKREIATLRALGFGRGAILLSFVLESVCLALVGGLLGVLLALPINGLTTGVGSFATFSETAFKFRVTPFAIALGLLFSAVIGLLGGLLPAWAAARTNLVLAMREN